MNDSVDGPWIHYITRTGALWNGPIGQARFTIRLSIRPHGVRFPAIFKMMSYVERLQAGGEATTELIFEMQAWTPRRDLIVYFSNGLLDWNEACPGREFVILGEDHEQDLRRALGKLSHGDLRLCRNLPYALHGYYFRSTDLRRHYYPGIRKTEDGQWMGFQYHPNPHFEPALLSSWEQRYVRLIKEEETRRK